jgi:sugar lactone lactonase YvrE
MAVGFVLCGSCAACTRTATAIFPSTKQELSWPPPPHPARIRYVGELRTAEDLKPPRRGRELFGRIFGGRKPPQPLYGPRAVTVTSGGNKLWVGDLGGRCIHLFDLENRSYRKIENAGVHRLLTPVALCPGPVGSIFVCDSEAVAIHRLSERDGSWIQSLRLPEEMQRPVAMYFDNESQELIVVDVLGHDIKVFDSRGDLQRVMGQRGEKAGEFNFPSAIAGDARLLWIADTGNNRIQGINRDGSPEVVFGQAGDASGDLAMPKAVAVDSEGHVYVVDGRFENVQIFSEKGELLLFFGEEGTGPGQFWLPGGIWIEPTGRIWICDMYNRRLQLFQYVGELDADF